ncbi:MAG: hypothetical protein BZY81_03725 [SAR202 cluster bacterium Io17-Chloro-G4]|nr:MAG: hypothetical protein BZY81_03725 [SAR202 cluster bacterium Io17-Chloro-G4]
MTDTSEVVIVGGGAAGCSVAYYLALAGVKSTIIEKEGIGSQASGYSAGGLNPLQGTGIPGPLSDVAMESYLLHQDLFPKLMEATGVNYQWRITSLVKVAFDDEDPPEIQETFDTFTSTDGFEADMLDREQLLDLEPRISSEVSQGVVARGNASLDSYKYTLALAQAAEKMGVSVQSGTVQGLERTNGRVTGVLLEGRVLHCDQLVMATGPWSRIAEPWLGAYVPVDPLKGEILRMELPGGPLGHDMSGGGGSLYPKPDGLVWCGTTEDWRGYDRSTTESARQRILNGAVKLIPDMAKAQLVLHTACLRPVTPDWLPIIGRAPGLDNAFLATGAGKKGILLSPAIGKAVADQITKGETQLSVAEFDPARFASPTD